jgi:hypothetical protein
LYLLGEKQREFDHAKTVIPSHNLHQDQRDSRLLDLSAKKTFHQTTFIKIKSFTAIWGCNQQP